jgi:hypothetical protein
MKYLILRIVNACYSVTLDHAVATASEWGRLNMDNVTWILG